MDNYGVVRVPQEEAMAPEAGLGGGGGGGGGPQLTDFSSLFVDGGGPVLTQVLVIPIFWGTSWAANPDPTIQQVAAAISKIVTGPYMDGLSQYRDIGRGQVVMAPGSQATTGDPPSQFSIADVETLVSNLIQSGALPSPQDNDQHLYMVFMPKGTRDADGFGGQHWWMAVGSQRAHVGWVLGGPLDSITWVFSHELAEACSDPEGTGITLNPPACGEGGWCEIGDVCQFITEHLDGVNVQSYWSQRDRACIIPTLNCTRFIEVQMSGRLSAIQNADGRIEVLARGLDGSLVHISETWPGGPWTGLNSLGGGITGRVASARNADGRIEAFARGTDGALWHVSQTSPNANTWGSWASLGGGIDDVFDVGLNPGGRLEVFARGTDGALWHIWQTAPGGPWSAWASLGGQIQSTLCVVPNADGRLEVFAKGTDGAARTIWQLTQGGWSGWTSLGGGVAQALAVGRNADGRLELFAHGTDNALWHIWQLSPNGGWGGWESLHGSVLDGLAVGSNADGRLEVFARAADFHLWHIWQTAPNSGWSQWASFAGQAGNALGAVAHPDGRIEVFTNWSTGGWVSHAWQLAPNDGWNP